MSISVIGHNLTLSVLATKMKWEMYGTGLHLFFRKRKHTISFSIGTIFLNLEF